MALTVFAEKMGFFHKGSAGFGVAPLDVCLSPPPGPVPIPYTNVLYAKDLIKGSKSVRIDGEPTFLEDYSETSTSIGDEGGTLGGSVITGVILGKGYFMVWSMTVSIEGLGVCRHGDMMGQNSASSPPSSIDAAAVNKPVSVSAPVPTPVATQQAAQAKVLQATGPGDSKPAPQVPCDFEKIEIECKHTGTGEGKRGFGPFEFTYHGQIHDNLPRPKDPKKKAFTPNIQGIAGTRDDKAETFKIKLSGGPGYGCTKQHPRITITNRATGEREVHEGKTEAQFKAKCFPLPPPPHASMSPAAIIGYFWFPPGAVTRYVVEVESCGVLANHGPGFRKLARQIDVFSSDKYKLSIEIPTIIGRNYEKAGTGPRKFPLVEHMPKATPVEPGKSRWNKETDYNKELPANNPYHGLKPIDRAIVEVVSTVKLERNSEDLKVTESLGKLVRAIAELENNIQSIMNFIKDLQPTVGWKFSFKIGFFKGEMTLEWGSKEGPDHTVFNWWKFTPSLTLLSLELEAEFGVDICVLRAFKVTLVFFGKVAGEVKLETSVEATHDRPTWELMIGAEISGELGIKLALGADWATATGKVAIAFPFEAKPEIDPQKGFGIPWKLESKGIKANIIGSIKFVGSFSKSVTLKEPSKLGEGRFPEGGKQPTGVPAPGGQVGGKGKP
ncbi:DUF4150 domain-containing protein [Nannocystaceae bacterium ST9]